MAVNYPFGPEVAEEVAEAVRELGGSAMTVQADVTDLDQLNAMVKSVIDEWGTIDVLVNNAGTTICSKNPFFGFVLASLETRL